MRLGGVALFVLSVDIVIFKIRNVAIRPITTQMISSSYMDHSSVVPARLTTKQRSDKEKGLLTYISNSRIGEEKQYMYHSKAKHNSFTAFVRLSSDTRSVSQRRLPLSPDSVNEPFRDKRVHVFERVPKDDGDIAFVSHSRWTSEAELLLLDISP